MRSQSSFLSLSVSVLQLDSEWLVIHFFYWDLAHRVDECHKSALITVDIRVFQFDSSGTIRDINATLESR